MFKMQALRPDRGMATRLASPIVAAASSVAVALLLTCNVAAVQLVRDEGSYQAQVTPRVDPGVGSRDYLEFRLATTAGYQEIVFG